MDLAIVIVTSTIIAVLCFFIGRRCGNKGTSDNPIAIVSEKPDAELERELKSKIDELKTQVADMESRLKEKDEALKSALSEDASTFSSTLQAEIETLKKLRHPQREQILEPRLFL